jgi:predicted GIY-YIG superfamily endonuclease
MSMNYPDCLPSLQDDGRSIFYIVSREPGYFKFGITTCLRTRMMKHHRDFQFTSIDALIDCGCDSIMRAVETEFKQEAAKKQLIVRRYDKTEVIAVQDITPFVAWVRARIVDLSRVAQPPNDRGRDKKYKLEVEVLTRLREQDQAEIAILREKIKTLEELLAARK